MKIVRIEMLKETQEWVGQSGIFNTDINQGQGRGKGLLIVSYKYFLVLFKGESLIS